MLLASLYTSLLNPQQTTSQFIVLADHRRNQISDHCSNFPTTSITKNMDEGGETSTSHQVSPNEVVHAPVTPAKPTQPDPNTIHRNWLESPFDEAIFEETSVKKSFNFWESNLRSTSQIHDTGGMYNKFSVDDAYIWNSMSCRDLLALADATIRKGSDNSTQQYGRVDVNNHLSDLNLPPQTITGVHVSTGLSLQFTPVTANKGRRSEHKQVASDIVNINADERTNPNIAANKKDGSNLDEQSQADGSTLVEANQNLEKGLTEQTNVNETPQPKERRRKHRPKVVKEGQQKRARKPATPKPEGSSTGKRKYVRRKVVEKSTETPVVEEASGTIDLSTEQQTKKSCKRKINFDEPEKQSEVMVEKTQVEQVGAKGCATSEVENCLQGLEHESPSPITPSKTDLPQGRSRNNVKVKCRINFLQEKGDIEPSTVPSPNESNCSTSIRFSTVEEAHGSKVELSSKLAGIKHLDKNARENSCDLLEAYLSPYTDYNSVSKQGMQLPAVNMNKRHRKNQSVMTADTSASKAPSYKYMQNFNRKKTEAFTMVHGSVPFAGRIDGRYQQQTCTEAYTADFHVGIATKKKTMKTTTVPSWYNDHRYSTTHIGWNSSLRCISIHDVDALINQFELLNINRRMVEENRNAVVPFMSGCHVPYMSGYHEKNALVVYQQNGRLVPYEGVFNPVKRRKSRPKVDLDDETSRVWMLLLEDINSEGIDGTDEAKAKWWEEERRVFRGRADSFIARMHLVQGDRRFSRWKGSVLDSVVGVFLTQNVSDHLSSSAFMSLAARYPLKSNNSSEAPPHEEESILSVKEPWQEDEDCGSMNLQDAYSCEEKETANELSKNSGSTVDLNDNSECEVLELSEKESAVDDILSSQNSTYTSPSSVQSSVGHITERLGSCSKHNFGEQKDGSKSNVHDGCTSFVELLHMQGTTVVNKTHSQRQADDSSEQTLPTKEYELPNTCSLGALEVESFELREEREIIQMKNEKSASVESGLSAESASQTTVQMVKTISSQESVKSCSTCNNCEVQEVFDITHVSAETSKSTKINKIVEASGETVHRVVEFNLNVSRNDQIVDGMAEGSSKIKKMKTGKEQIKVDWDNLRLHAEVKQKRERTPDTVDSLDYEAVRAADVDEVADSIKERGMNNRLAARIKDMLDRLVRDHGSIDLEWLRDVPPDKAKEYLLSFKGLGLKSVECIRLLTLHHLAFPVDTNVGRIAVRLGWVPLQPLPESLQLHLLELYPVQETIQKYLWPRLCKLDQRTLYELHYQMITFGKVFCTKTKPNCNACPLRGECRHFASAFASARLGLPAPEESLPSLTRNRTGQSPVGMIDLSPASEQLQPPSEVQNCNPVIVEQATSGPTVEGPATPGPIVKVSASAEPIVEVPASPEPEQIQQASDIEDFCEDSEEIPMIKLNIEQFTQNLQTYMERHMELGEGDMSKALVAITSEAASIPTPKLKNVSQLRTEHQVYELPDSHPLLEGLDTREPDDPCPYLLAIWIPGETADSIQPPEGQCCSQESGILCNEETCFFCNSTREANFQTVRGTLLIPCRTAMRGSFPLNGTYFQVNEVFADHTSSLNPIDVPRSWLWNLPRRTVYFGTSIPTIFKGMTTEAIQYCFWRGFVCVRGFDQETRAPRPLMARLHFPASRLKRSKAKTDEKRG